MSHTMRWRYGDTQPVVATVDAETSVELGDLLFWDGDDAKPAALQPDQGTEAANQQLFASKFLGVAMQAGPSGESQSIRVATAGVFEFTTPGGSFDLGDLVGVDENAAGTALENQRLVKVTDPQLAIGRVARRANNGSTVWVAICSTVMAGGVKGTTAT